MLHVTWTEWKNLFSLEVYCRDAKLQVDGLVRSYGPQTLRIYRMSPEMGPPALEERSYGTEDLSWAPGMGALRRGADVRRAAAGRARRMRDTRGRRSRTPTPARRRTRPMRAAVVQ